MTSPLLIEIGCEEIPARMIAAGASDLRSRLLAVLDQAGLPHGEAASWGGPRRLAVRIDAVAPGLPDTVEKVLGPPAASAFAPDGTVTPAGAGFARKQGIAPEALQRIETERGVYAGFTRALPGRSAAQIVAAGFPASVAAMSFAKTMRWGDGAHRWVRPVHWIVALHGEAVVDLEIFGIRSGRISAGHRFLAAGPVTVANAGSYEEALRAGRVLVDPAERRATLERGLQAAASGAGGAPVPDDALLREITDLVEWPGVVVGRFDREFLDLPREILVTTLRHHQKAFSVQAPSGLLPAFLSVANTDRDPAGHVRRGNEWVVIGRLGDARFFWNEDRKRALRDRLPELALVTFHKKLGSYADKTRRNQDLARAIAERLELGPAKVEQAIEAAGLAKADLVTGLVGEFPELQGIVGGLLLHADGADPAVSQAVYEHYRPASAEDAIPATELGCVVAVADRLDTIGSLLRAGEAPTGSRDPFGLRRALGGVFRIVEGRRWTLRLDDLVELGGGSETFAPFLTERYQNYLRDQGFAQNEINAVLSPSASPTLAMRWPLAEIRARLEIVKTLRDRQDFRRLVELTKRVDNILQKQGAIGAPPRPAPDEPPASAALSDAHATLGASIARESEAGRFAAVVDLVAAYVDPVARFFDEVLVLDADRPEAAAWRCALLAGVRATLTHDFDIRELSGQADTKR